MNRKIPDLRRIPDDLADSRCYERLKEDFGLEDEAAEVIMSLRRQVILLQARLEALEFTLTAYQVEYGVDRKQASEEFLEASWEDIS